MRNILYIPMHFCMKLAGQAVRQTPHEHLDIAAPSTGSSALHVAVGSSRLSLVRLLLAARADVPRPEKPGLAPWRNGNGKKGERKQRRTQRRAIREEAEKGNQINHPASRHGETATKPNQTHSETRTGTNRRQWTQRNRAHTG